MTRNEIVDHLTTNGIVAIIRTAVAAEDVLRIVDALAEGGVRSIEITMMTTNALDCIEAASNKFAESDVLMGVGSVLDSDTAERAIGVGAQYIVSPVTSEGVINTAHDHDKAVLPGAFTPTEIFRARELGGDLIKVFPANFGGLEYVKAIRAPLPQIPLFPTGGVTLENLEDFFRAGVAGVGLGNGLIPPDLVAARDFKGLAAHAARFVDAFAALGR